VDGVVSVELGIKGKPAPDIFANATDNHGGKFRRAIVVAAAVSGVQLESKDILVW
jgi:beta-phosphoglucomutase-like phosphatase (HAD superfamily)